MIEDDAPVYVHAPEPAWVLLEMTLSGEARDFTVRYEGTPVYRGTVDGESTFNVPVLLEAGYSTVSVALEPPCPANPPHPTLVCSSVQVENVAVGEPAAVSLPESIPFERGLTLQNAHVDEDVSDGCWTCG